MPDKPKFGITTDPEKTSKERENFINSTQSQNIQQSAHTAPKSNTNNQSINMPKFGMDTDKNQKRTKASIFTLRPWWFWLKAYAVSIVAALYWAYKLPTATGLENAWYILIPNLILFPFASAMLEEIGSEINLPVPRISYIIFGNNGQLEDGLGSCLMTPIVLVARFGVFLIEWLFSIILGVISLIVMAVGISKGA